MKKIKLLIATFYILSSVFAQKKSEKITISIDKSVVSINKKIVSNDWGVTTFTNILDTANRSKIGFNKVHTYDNLGLILFEAAPKKVPSGLVSEFQIILDDVELLNVTPSNIYKGKIKFEKLQITNSTSIEDIRKALEGYTESISKEEIKSRFAKGGIYIYVLYNDKHKLCKIIIGKDKE